MGSEKVRAHLYISGKVQGVFYRSTTYEEATLRGLSGWVRNTRDGGVEAVFEGEKTAVDEMIKWCYSGPPLAVVKDIKVQWERPKGERGFHIRY